MKEYGNNLSGGAKLIYGLYKDKPVKNCNYFKYLLKKEHNISQFNYRDVYREIVNYQIDKYGEQLWMGRNTDSDPEFKKKCESIRNRNYYKNKTRKKVVE